MKYIKLLCFLVGILNTPISLLAQSNTFPSSGNVGVGTTSQVAKFQVVSAGNGQIAVLGNGIDSDFRMVVRQDQTSNADGALVAEVGLDHVNTRNSAIRFHRGWTSTGGFMSFTSDSGLERMRITANGNIGIGTTSPTQKLDVNGTIRTREVNVTTIGWADYVFKPEYKLISLAELESYIHENGHLPNVPSEKEVLENGVNLLEMNVKLLEKVEELTLYIIQLKKEVEEIKAIQNK